MKLRCKKLERDFELLEGRNVVGRSPECQIALPPRDKEISREHAECFYTGNQVRIRDLSSRNKTRLNSIELVPQQWYVLQAGDSFHICDYEFVLEDEQLPDLSHGTCVVVDDRSRPAIQDSSIAMSASSLHKYPEFKQFDQLQAIIRITDVLRGILDRRSVLQKAAETLHKIFSDVERAAIGLIDEQGGIRPEWWHLRYQNPQSEIRLSKTIVNQVVTTQEAFLSQDPMRQFQEAESIPELSISAVMCAPLFGEHDRVMGFVYVDTTRRGQFETSDLQVLAAVATQISLALGYARMHDSVLRDRMLRHDLEQARLVQQQYVPSSSPDITGYDVTFFYRAARHIGGDYLDAISLANGQNLFVLGDVEGKGAAAALTMVRLASETRASAEVCAGPAEMLTRLNQRMTEKWVTFVAVQLDEENHKALVANAAQEWPLLRKADGTLRELTEESGGLPLSVLEEEVYVCEEVSLEVGDALVLYSDGFTDAESEAGERFGKTRLREHVQAANGDSQTLADRICEAVDQFRGDVSQFDDMCLITIKRVT